MSKDGYFSALEHVTSLITTSTYITILTGAGISTPSGIPDFRTSKTGLWKKADPMDAISLSNFLKNPDIFYQWYHPFAKQLNQSKPNKAHMVLAKMQEKKVIQSIITQNIDDLHHAAGKYPPIELHGNLKNWQCLQGHPIPQKNNYFTHFCETGEKPVCPICNKVLKPAIVFFEEALPIPAWDAAYAEAQKCDLMIVVGSSLVVGPANELPYIAMQNGARMIIFTLSDTPLDPYANIVIHEDVVTVLTDLENKLGL